MAGSRAAATTTGPLTASGPARVPPAGYRRDIDGLRAVAVMAVVLYHLHIGPLHGGFVGVDVFFVISGYLITGILMRQMARGDFTFADFYRRRILRIFPALFAMLAVVMAVGLAVLLPSDLVALGHGTAATLLFASNVVFWRASGYFDGSADTNLLLHTWSLAVEEQFYIVFPLLLIAAFRFAPARMRLLIAAAVVATFAACVALQSGHPTATFFLAPFRAWELMIGALLAAGALPAVSHRALRECLAVLGLLLVAVAVVWMAPDARFPGWRAAVPVLGAALVIHCGSAGTTSALAVLRLRWVVSIGAISYSLYLWHWPLLVLANYLVDFAPLGALRWPLLATCIALAAASYRWIETPLRHLPSVPTARVFAVAGSAFALTMAAAVALVMSVGLPGRFPPRVLALEVERAQPIAFVACSEHAIDRAGLVHDCLLGDPAVPPTTVLWGDSHAVAWSPAMDTVLRDAGQSALLLAMSSCPPLVRVRIDGRDDCIAHNDAALAFLRASPDIAQVVMVASWPGYANEPGKYALRDVQGHVGNGAVFPRALAGTLDTLRAMGKRVWLIGPTSRAPGDIPLRMGIAASQQIAMPPPLARSGFDADTLAFHRAAHALAVAPSVMLSDPGPWLCDARDCRYEDQGLPLFRDDGHLNRRGAAYLAPALAREYARFQQMGEPPSR